MKLQKNKKIIIISLFLLILSVSGFAIKKGIKGGFCVSACQLTKSRQGGSSDYLFEANNNFSSHLEFPLRKTFFLQPEINYALKGVQTKETYSVLAPMVIQQWKFYYIEIPLLLKYNPHRENTLNPFFLFGPSISILLNTTYYKDDGLTKVYKATDKVKRFDYGLVFGTGINFKLGDEHGLTVDIRYYPGLLNMADKDNPTYDKIKCNAVHVMVGIQF